MNRYIDTHAHYADEAFDTDRDELIKKMFESGVVCIIDPAVDLASSVKALGIARNYNNYYCAAGIHPHEAGGATEEDYNKLSALIKDDLKSAERKIVAVGETGLDYHYDFSPRDIQIENFRKNIRLALELGLPLIVHDREAHADCIKVLLEEGAFSGKVLYHCYSGSAKYALELLKYGCMFSFGGAVTFKNAKKFDEILKVIPPENILPETDSPYMAPVPLRGSRNNSMNLQYIYPRLSLLTGLDEADFEAKMTENTKRSFNISDI